MKIKLPQYSGKDYLVLAIMVLPFTFLINFGIFGNAYFAGTRVFLLATIITGIVFTLYFILCGGIAVFFKKRFTREEDAGKKLGTMIFFYLVLTGLVLLLLFRGYESIALFDYSFNKMVLYGLIPGSVL